MKKLFFIAVPLAIFLACFSTAIVSAAGYDHMTIIATTDKVPDEVMKGFESRFVFEDQGLFGSARMESFRYKDHMTRRPYAMFAGFTQAGPCRFYFVIIFEDHDDNDPSNDSRLTSGWVSDCPLGPGISPQSEPGPSLEGFEEFEGFTTPSELNQLNPVKQFELSSKPLTVIPNPAKESIRVEVKNEKIKSGFVTDMNGHIVKQLPASDADKFNVQISDWPAGTYVVYLLTTHDEVRSGKFVIAE